MSEATETYLWVVTHPMLWVFLGLTAMFFVVQWLVSLEMDSPTTPDERIREFADGLGMGRLHPVLFLILALTWGVVAVTLFVGLYMLLWDIILHEPPEGKEEVWTWRFALAQLAALTTVLGAVIALPITINRLILTRRQTDTAEETLFNEKVNKATSDLAAQRQVTCRIGSGTDERILTEWQDDILVRAAAIDRLEALAKQNPRETQRIARILALYLRELSRDHPPESEPQTTYSDKVFNWARRLVPVRPDMESAAQSLGRLKHVLPLTSDTDRIDLSGVNFQGFSLSHLSFQNARLENASLQGAKLVNVKLSGANLKHADFLGANLEGADLSGAFAYKAEFTSSCLDYASFQAAYLAFAEMANVSCRQTNFEHADLIKTNFTAANFDTAQLQQARLTNTKLVGAVLQNTNITGADFWLANMSRVQLSNVECTPDTNFEGASLTGAALRSIDLADMPDVTASISQIFADASVKLVGGDGPEHPNWPSHWAKEVLPEVVYDQNYEQWLEENDGEILEHGNDNM